MAVVVVAAAQPTPAVAPQHHHQVKVVHLPAQISLIFMLTEVQNPHLILNLFEVLDLF